MDKKEIGAIVGAYTGFLCGNFSDMHEYIEKIMGRPVFTHEMADKKIADLIKEKATSDFIRLGEWCSK